MKNPITPKRLFYILIYFLCLFIARYFITGQIRHIAQCAGLFFVIISFITFKEKGLYIAMGFYNSIIIHFDKYYLYPTLLFMTVAVLYNRRYLVQTAIFYHINTITLFIIDKTALHINAIIFYSVAILLFIILFFYPHISNEPLKLKKDEIKLLDEWSEKELLKSCICFSKNIKTEKLKQAKIRNNLKSNEELKAIYLIQIKENKIIILD